jgi:hypothetical protein
VDFTYTDEQNQLRRSVREFAEGEILAHVMEWDEVSHFPIEIMPKLAEMGLLGIIFPEEYGGPGLGYIEYVIAIEELSRVDGSVGIIVAAHNSLCSNHIFKFGSEAQKQKYLSPLAQGKKIGAWSLTEPEAGSDAGGTRTTAKREGNHWVINGAKTFTTNGHYADVCVAMAVTDKSKGSHGISAFIIEKGTPGFKPGAPATPPKSSFPIAVSRRKIFSATKAKASLAASKFSTAAASLSQLWRSAWRRARSMPP